MSDLHVSSSGKCVIQTQNSGMASVACSSVQTLISSTQVKTDIGFLQTQNYPEISQK